MKYIQKLCLFYIDYYIGSVIYCLFVLKDALLNIIISILAIMLEGMSAIFTGRYVLASDGRPVRRTTICGKEFFVKEPSIIKEISYHLRGKTILRDSAGVPITDENGNFVKTKSYLLH